MAVEACDRTAGGLTAMVPGAVVGGPSRLSGELVDRLVHSGWAMPYGCLPGPPSGSSTPRRATGSYSQSGRLPRPPAPSGCIGRCADLQRGGVTHQCFCLAVAGLRGAAVALTLSWTG